MLSNLAFTLYEIFGYLIPGGISLVGLVLLYWLLFLAYIPLKIGTFKPSAGTWVAVVVTSYILGHAMQAVGNLLLRHIETEALAIKKEPWLYQQARQAAAQILQTSEEHLKPCWVYRVLDEYAVQNGKPGDRDMFIYREGFYRGTSVALFFLAAMVLVRTARHNASIQFCNWTLALTCAHLVVTAVLVALLGWLFLRRYGRFTQYRVTHGVLSALVLFENAQANGPSSGKDVLKE